MSIDHRLKEDEKKDEQQLIQEGLETHQKTTNQLQNIKKATDETNQIAIETNKDLVKQREQLFLVQGDIEGVKDSSTKAKKLIDYLKLPCCCQCCYDCCDKDDKQYMPKRSPVIQAQQQNGSPPQQNKENNDKNSSSEQEKENQKPSGYSGRTKNRKVKIGNLEGEAQQKLDEQTDKQEELLDDISQGVEGLKQQAQKQFDEVNQQNKQLTDLRTAVDDGTKQVKDNYKEMHKI